MNYFKRLVVCVLSVIVSSQAHPAEAGSEEYYEAQIELARAIGRDKIRVVFEQNLPLTEVEAAEFWPLYDDYMEETTALNDRLLTLLDSYARDYMDKTLDDKSASRLMNDYFKLEKDKVSLKQKYKRRFSRVMPDVKVAHFFQLVNRIDTLLDLGLSQNIPLVLE